NSAIARSSPVGLGMLVSARSNSPSSSLSTALQARSSHVCWSDDRGMASTGGCNSVAVNGSSRVVYAGRKMAVYNASTLTEQGVSTLRARLRGPVISPSDAEYDAARRVWNASVNRFPGAIARCIDAVDVTAAIN